MHARGTLKGTAALACLLIAAAAGAAGAAVPPRQPPADAALIRDLTALRDAFVRRIDEEGYRLCPRPGIDLGAAPSGGRYLAARNLILITPWSQLSAQQQQGFEGVPGPATPAGARAAYESGTYRWVFVQQLGHWWQVCRHMAGPETYAAQSGANRMALAFWRERDPRFAAAIVRGATELVNAVPDPLPGGQDAQAWLEAHPGEQLASPAHEWLQARMIATLAQETPQPSFHKSLSQPMYPY
jgi:hypothetical protein